MCTPVHLAIKVWVFDGSDGWESVTVKVDDLVNQGLILDTIDTGIVIWAPNIPIPFFK